MPAAAVERNLEFKNPKRYDPTFLEFDSRLFQFFDFQSLIDLM